MKVCFSPSPDKFSGGVKDRSFGPESIFLRKHTSKNRPLIVNFSLLYILFFDALLKEGAGYQIIMQKNTCKGHLFENQEVGPVFRQFITKLFWNQRIFQNLRNSLFQNKRPLLKKQNGAKPLQGKILLVFSRSLFIHYSNILDLQLDFFILFYAY